MAREVIVSTWCDPCLADGDRIEGREVTVSVGGAAPIMLALCDAHERTLWAPLVGVLDRLGQPAPAAATPARPVKGGNPETPCPVPGCGATATAKRISDHVRRSHGLPGVRAARVLYGQPARPEPGSELFGSDDVPPCPECGLAAANRTGLAAHVRLKHPDMPTAIRDGLFAQPGRKAAIAQRREAS